MPSTDLVTYLDECGANDCSGRDKLTLKVESFTVTVKRSPIIIPIPLGYIVGIDLGTNSSVITMQGVIDYSLTELPVDNTSGTFHAGYLLSGDGGWNGLTSPIRSSAPTAVIVAGSPNLSHPTSLWVSNATSFFVDNERVTSGGAAAFVNRPFPTKKRLEEAIRYWSSNGQLTLYARETAYQGYFTGAEFDLVGGREDRFQFRLTFAEGTQHLP